MEKEYNYRIFVDGQPITDVFCRRTAKKMVGKLNTDYRRAFWRKIEKEVSNEQAEENRV